MRANARRKQRAAERGERGFTVIEVMVAVLILSVGMLALVSTAATVTRMIGQGQRFSEASTLAAKRFEILRATDCSVMTSNTATEGAYTLKWAVADTAAGKAKAVTLTVTSPTGRGDRTDTFNTTISCK